MSLVRFLAFLTLGTSLVAQTSRPASPPSPQAQQQSNSPTAADKERSGADPLLDLPPLPKSDVALLGGIVTKLDRVRDRMVVKAFGGRDMNIAFDLRTKITRDGVPADARDIHPGNHVYVDTIYDSGRVFAKSVRIETKKGQGDARGQIEAYDTKRGVISVRDQVSPTALDLKVTPQTSVTINDRKGSLADIHPGALVIVNFSSSADSLSTAHEIKVLASPGQSFTFAGTITFVDFRSKRFAIANRSDDQTYDIALDSTPSRFTRQLRQGSDATVMAVFDGKYYQARSIEISSSAAKPPSSTND
jgi:hypothetical protein